MSGHGGESGPVFGVEELSKASYNFFGFLFIVIVLIEAAVPVLSAKELEKLHASAGGGGH